MNEHALLLRICEAYRAILGSKLVGLYVHGSIAFGCFTWATGDIDRSPAGSFLVVADAPPTPPEKEALIRTLLDMTPEAPPKGFEMSVVLRKYCAPFVYPTPFELHFSNTHKARAAADLTAYCRTINGVDPDLAAHFTVVRSVGYALYGAPVDAVFGAVPRACYVDGLLADVDSAAADILTNPVYVTLNLCRVLAYLTDGAVLSKRQGGEWGLRHLPKGYHPLLQNALDAYGGAEFSRSTCLAGFAADMLARIHTLTDQ